MKVAGTVNFCFQGTQKKVESMFLCTCFLVSERKGERCRGRRMQQQRPDTHSRCVAHGPVLVAR